MEDFISHKTIYSIYIEGSYMTKLVDIGLSHEFYELSPNGKRVLFTADGDYGRDIFVMDVDGTNLKNLTDNIVYGDNHPSWSFDGSKIAFLSRIDGNGIYIMDEDGKNRIKVVSVNEESNLSYPSWSPDGSKIVFILKRGGDYSINSVNADGSNQTLLYFGEIWQIDTPVWTPQLFN